MRWEELVRISLLGTNRSKLVSKEESGEDKNIRAQADPARYVLVQAAEMQLKLKAGFEPELYEETFFQKAPQHTERFINTRATYYFKKILQSKNKALFEEFVQLLIQYNKAVPPEFIPELINRNMVERRLAHFEKLIGQRGLWLLELNPNWHRLIVQVSDDFWENGSVKERVLYLTQLRKKYPSLAIERLRETWKDENVNNKKQLLKTLSTALNAADDDFLEEVLKEKSADLRKVASNIAARLPSSSWNTRMENRIVKMMAIKNKHLVFTLPNGVDAEMIRDGVLADVSLYGGGNRISILAQILRKFSFSRLASLFKINPLQLLDLLLQSEYSAVLLPALIEGAIFNDEQESLQLFITYWFESEEDKVWERLDTSKLIEALSYTTFNEIASNKVKQLKDIPKENSAIQLLLSISHQPWSRSLSLEFYHMFKKYLSKNNASMGWGDWHLRKLLKSSSFLIPPILYPKIDTGWPQELPVWGAWERDIVAAMDNLAFRYKMAKAIAAD